MPGIIPALEGRHSGHPGKCVALCRAGGTWDGLSPRVCDLPVADTLGYIVSPLRGLKQHRPPGPVRAEAEVELRHSKAVAGRYAHSKTSLPSATECPVPSVPYPAERRLFGVLKRSFRFGKPSPVGTG